ncbi:MAG: tetratricopeptide repeat protein [Planctomycetota bacterium]
MTRRGVHGVVLFAVALAVAGCADPSGKVYRFDAQVPPAVQPAEADKAYRAAVAQLKAGDYAAAQANLETAVRFDPQHGRAFNNLGWIYYRNGQLYRAAHAFNTATLLLPDHPDPVSNLGLTLAAAGMWDRAVELQTRALEMDPGNLGYQSRLAFAQVKRGDELASLSDLLEAVLTRTTREDWARWAQNLLARLRSSDPAATSDL